MMTFQELEIAFQKAFIPSFSYTVDDLFNRALEADTQSVFLLHLYIDYNSAKHILSYSRLKQFSKQIDEVENKQKVGYTALKIFFDYYQKDLAQTPTLVTDTINAILQAFPVPKNRPSMINAFLANLYHVKANGTETEKSMSLLTLASENGLGYASIALSRINENQQKNKEAQKYLYLAIQQGECSAWFKLAQFTDNKEEKLGAYLNFLHYVNLSHTAVYLDEIKSAFANISILLTNQPTLTTIFIDHWLDDKRVTERKLKKEALRIKHPKYMSYLLQYTDNKVYQDIENAFLSFDNNFIMLSKFNVENAIKSIQDAFDNIKKHVDDEKKLESAIKEASKLIQTLLFYKKYFLIDEGTIKEIINMLNNKINEMPQKNVLIRQICQLTRASIEDFKKHQTDLSDSAMCDQINLTIENTIEDLIREAFEDIEIEDEMIIKGFTFHLLTNNIDKIKEICENKILTDDVDHIKFIINLSALKYGFIGALNESVELAEKAETANLYCAFSWYKVYELLCSNVLYQASYVNYTPQAIKEKLKGIIEENPQNCMILLKEWLQLEDKLQAATSLLQHIENSLNKKIVQKENVLLINEAQKTFLNNDNIDSVSQIELKNLNSSMTLTKEMYESLSQTTQNELLELDIYDPKKNLNTIEIKQDKKILYVIRTQLNTSLNMSGVDYYHKNAFKIILEEIISHLDKIRIARNQSVITQNNTSNGRKTKSELEIERKLKQEQQKREKEEADQRKKIAQKQERLALLEKRHKNQKSNPGGHYNTAQNRFTSHFSVSRPSLYIFKEMQICPCIVFPSEETRYYFPKLAQKVYCAKNDGEHFETHKQTLLNMLSEIIKFMHMNKNEASETRQNDYKEKVIIHTLYEKMGEPAQAMQYQKILQEIESEISNKTKICLIKYTYKNTENIYTRNISLKKQDVSNLLSYLKQNSTIFELTASDLSLVTSTYLQNICLCDDQEVQKLMGDFNLNTTQVVLH